MRMTVEYELKRFNHDEINDKYSAVLDLAVNTITSYGDLVAIKLAKALLAAEDDMKQMSDEIEQLEEENAYLREEVYRSEFEKDLY